MPPPGPEWYCRWHKQKLKWEWHWDWQLWWGKCVSAGNVWSEGWVRSWLHRGRCRCFRHCPACATCDGRARPETAACVATRGEKRLKYVRIIPKKKKNMETHFASFSSWLVQISSILLPHSYLMHVKCMDAHLSGGILWQDQTGELTLPCTAAWAHSPGISPTEREYKSVEKKWGHEIHGTQIKGVLNLALTNMVNHPSVVCKRTERCIQRGNFPTRSLPFLCSWLKCGRQPCELHSNCLSGEDCCWLGRGSVRQMPRRLCQLLRDWSKSCPCRNVRRSV